MMICVRILLVLGLATLTGCGYRERVAPCGPLSSTTLPFLLGLGDSCGEVRPVNGIFVP